MHWLAAYYNQGSIDAMWLMTSFSQEILILILFATPIYFCRSKSRKIIIAKLAAAGVMCAVYIIYYA